MLATFPQYYRPRPYQAEAHSLFQSKRVAGLVYPRQSGKDVCMSMEAVKRRLMFPKTAGVYIAPDTPAVRNILWDKRYFDRDNNKQLLMLQDNVPDSLVKWKDTRMEGKFENKSLLKLQGYFQSGRGENGVGTSFDDYWFTELALFTREDPIPRIMPIITGENGDKRLGFVSTPRGKRNNPLWQVMQMLEGDETFGILIRTIDDLNAMQAKYGLPPVRSQEQLEKDREMYLRRFGNARMFEQEYYCSFEEMDAAAVYGEALTKLRAEKRDESFNWLRNAPIHVAFDIGSSGVHSDATAWIAFQYVNGKIYLIDCGEGHGRALPEYVDVLASRPWFGQAANVILPWDGDHHEVSIRTTPADMMRQRLSSTAIQVSVLAKGTNIWTVKGMPSTGNSDIITMVQEVRLALYNTYINGITEEERSKGTDRPNCDHVIACMENYKYKYDTSMQQWSQFPVHDKWSHMMDALRYVVQATKELDFFKGTLYNPAAAPTGNTYQDDWSGVW